VSPVLALLHAVFVFAGLRLNQGGPALWCVLTRTRHSATNTQARLQLDRLHVGRGLYAPH
jgi:hypothetical protein